MKNCMRIFTINWLLIIILAALSGCSTTLLEGPKFKPANPPPAGKALVYIYRLNSTPYLLSPDLLINGKKILELANRGYSYVYLKPGDHEIKANWSFASGRKDLQGKIKVEAGKTYFIRTHGHVYYDTITYSSSGYLGFVPEDRALGELNKCLYIKPGLVTD